MITLLLFDINLIDDIMTNQLQSHISLERRTKAMKYHFMEDKKRCICSERLIQYYLQTYAGIEDKIDYGYNKFGKPFLMKYPNIHFNISHSGDWVIIGFSNHIIGVDIERVQKYEKEIANYCFTKIEKDYLYSAGESEYLNRFVEIWTLKESYIKYIGKGLSIDMRSFSIDLKHGLVIAQNKIQKDLRFKHFRFRDYYISLCMKRECDISLKVLSASEMMNLLK
ncbi:4'-phosphopantetheinyl transferase superfamily protein [Clostridium sp. E02]|uniref:4'-phosphopantetheinyl transferase family protein n=1 Tax=Clostridium sp. E02 TaxID=2487134 RepID=UPI000F54A8AF|nr:4'-phosphopantetheinyl transferase superfamily protein [Clostridium sp. E02]